MKITICGSIAFFPKMQEVEQELLKLSHEVKLPPVEVPGEDGKMIPVAEYYKIRKQAGEEATWVWERKAEAIRTHFNKIAWSDAILVLNYTKNGVEGYIGANTFLEMGVAFHLNKKIYLLKQVPNIPAKEEILGMKPIMIDGDLGKIG